MIAMWRKAEVNGTGLQWNPREKKMIPRQPEEVRT
jgi:hypothetical protein